MTLRKSATTGNPRVPHPRSKPSIHARPRERVHGRAAGCARAHAQPGLFHACQPVSGVVQSTARATSSGVAAAGRAVAVLSRPAGANGDREWGGWGTKIAVRTACRKRAHNKTTSARRPAWRREARKTLLKPARRRPQAAPDQHRRHAAAAPAAADCGRAAAQQPNDACTQAVHGLRRWARLRRRRRCSPLRAQHNFTFPAAPIRLKAGANLPLVSSRLRLCWRRTRPRSSCTVARNSATKGGSTRRARRSHASSSAVAAAAGRCRRPISGLRCCRLSRATLRTCATGAHRAVASHSRAPFTLAL